MRKRVVTVLLLAAAVSSGCVGRINNMMRSWENHDVPELFSKWGPPQQVFADGQGGHVLVYTATRSYTVPGSSTTNTTVNGSLIGNQFFGTATSQTVYNPAMTYQWQTYRMFFVDANGRIYRWAWKGI